VQIAHAAEERRARDSGRGLRMVELALQARCDLLVVAQALGAAAQPAQRGQTIRLELEQAAIGGNCARQVTQALFALARELEPALGVARLARE
jgi:hypothetical protein